MNNDLAEFIGIFIGDGSLYIREEKCSYEFKFTGNITDEIPYFEDHVSKLASRILKRKIETKLLDSAKTVGLYFCSKSFALYLATIDITAGPKIEKIKIPELIMENQQFAISCLLGIFDTDGCFTLKRNKLYPVITITMKNRYVISQIKQILDSLSIPCCVSFDISYFDSRTDKVYSKHFLSLNGHERVQRWFEIIGSNNPKTIKKYNYFRMKNSGEWI